MKKLNMMILLIGACLLMGCGEAPEPKLDETFVEENILEETLIEEIIIEEEFIEEETSENLLRGYGLFTEEYIDELYYNSIDYEVSLREWRNHEDNGYTDNEIKYILLREYGIL